MTFSYLLWIKVFDFAITRQVFIFLQINCTISYNPVTFHVARIQKSENVSLRIFSEKWKNTNYTFDEIYAPIFLPILYSWSLFISTCHVTKHLVFKWAIGSSNSGHGPLCFTSQCAPANQLWTLSSACTTCLRQRWARVFLFSLYHWLRFSQSYFSQSCYF